MTPGFVRFRFEHFTEILMKRFGLMLPACLLLALAPLGCGKNEADKDGDSKVAELIRGKWKYQAKGFGMTLEFSADQVTGKRLNADGSGPSWQGTYKIVDDHTLEWPKPGELGEEQVTIDSISMDKLVLSGGVTKLDKAEFTRPAEGDTPASARDKLVGKWVMVKDDGKPPPGEFVAEFTADGKLKVSVKAGNQNQTMEMNFELNGDKLKMTGPNAQTVIVKTLTDDTLITVDQKGKTSEFKKEAVKK
jgi:uncharacterized protein (TIGR03066 family)